MKATITLQFPIGTEAYDAYQVLDSVLELLRKLELEQAVVTGEITGDEQ